MRRVGCHVALLLIACLAVLTTATKSYAVRPDEMLKDPVLESRAVAISRDIRCVVCQSESIEDSDADIAHDMRVIIREQLTAGASDDDVRAFLVARYGDFVLLKPPFEWKTALIWTGPFLLLIGAAAFVVTFYRRSVARDASPLNASEQARLERFLSAHEDPAQKQRPGQIAGDAP